MTAISYQTELQQAQERLDALEARTRERNYEKASGMFLTVAQVREVYPNAYFIADYSAHAKLANSHGYTASATTATWSLDEGIRFLRERNSYKAYPIIVKTENMILRFRFSGLSLQGSPQNPAGHK